MVIVTGTLTDFGIETLVEPVLRFTPSGPGMQSNRLLATHPVDATLSDSGFFSVGLTPTDGVTPERWYEVSAVWLDAAGNFTQLSIWERLYVPEGGGDISTFPNQPLRADAVWVGLESNPPPAGFKGWWLVAAVGDPDPGYLTGSGDLRRVI